MTRRIGAALAFGVALALAACAAVGLWKPAACEAKEECRLLASFDVPAGLQDYSIPRAKLWADGEYVLGRFPTPERDAGELRTGMSNGRRTETFLVIRGTRLGNVSDPPSQPVLACIKAKGSMLGPVEGAGFHCQSAPNFKIIRDSQRDYYAIACRRSRCILCARERAPR